MESSSFYCDQCSAKISQHARFCSHCGATVSREPGGVESSNDKSTSAEVNQIEKVCTDHKDAITSVDHSQSRPMAGLLRNRPLFVLSYILLIIPSYVLPYVGSNSALLNTANSAMGHGNLPAFWMHAVALYLATIVAWFRGIYMAKPWIGIYPFLATIFDLVPGLNFFFLIPTGFHVAALISGVSGEATSARNGLGKNPPLIAGIGLAGLIGMAIFNSIEFKQNSEPDPSGAQQSSNIRQDNASNDISKNSVPPPVQTPTPVVHPSPELTSDTNSRYGSDVTTITALGLGEPCSCGSHMGGFEVMYGGKNISISFLHSPNPANPVQHPIKVTRSKQLVENWDSYICGATDEKCPLDGYQLEISGRWDGNTSFEAYEIDLTHKNESKNSAPAAVQTPSPVVQPKCSGTKFTVNTQYGEVAVRDFRPEAKFDGTAAYYIEKEDFHLLFFVPDKSFTIILHLLKGIPYEKVRKAAEQFFLTTLCVSEQDACKLNFNMGAPRATNSDYPDLQGKNIKLSFCR